MKSPRIFLGIILCTTLALTACGAASGSPAAAVPTEAPTSAPPPTAAPTATAITLNATLSDAGLTPKDFSVPGGANVTFTVKNTRTDERDCIFRDLTTIKLYPGQAQWSLVQIAAGTTKSLAMIAPSQPASYQIDCGLEGFSGQPRQPATGMVGTLVVK